MAITDIYGKVRYLKTNSTGGRTNPLNIAGDVWAVVDRGPDDDGYIYTFRITSSGNTIGTIELISSYEFLDDADLYSEKILIHVNGDVYAALYSDKVAGEFVGKISTVNIDSDGNITPTGFGTVAFQATDALGMDFIKVAANMFAITWRGDAAPTVATIGISDAGEIDGALTDTEPLTAGTCNITHIFSCAGDIFAIAYQTAGGWYVDSISINAAGAISAVIEHHALSSSGLFPYFSSVNLAGDNYAIAYMGAGYDGYIDTLEIDNAGDITAIDSWEFEPDYASDPSICHVTGTYYAIAWKGLYDVVRHSFVATIEIADNGTIVKALKDTKDYADTYHDVYAPEVYLISAAATGLLFIAGMVYASQGTQLYTIGIGTWAVSAVTTQAMSDLAPTTATGHGNVTDLGAPAPFQHGHCWGTSPNPTISDDKTELGAVVATGAFTSSLTDLIPGTTYYGRAYVTNMLGTVYGNEVSFGFPIVTTDPATGIGIVLADLNGTLDDDGSEACDCGFQWGETVAYGNTTPTQSKVTGETFAQAISGLTPGRTYHFRAFATNAAGTSYGSDRTFITLGAISTVTTDLATGVGMVLADLNGTLDDDGGVACDCGFQWGETVAYGNTTPTQSKNTGETFAQAISGLTPGTTYHFRASSTNVSGTSYGADRTFTTYSVSGGGGSRGFALSRHEL